MTERPLILISNDDGYQAKGILCLIDMLQDMADIIVCAPECIWLPSFQNYFLSITF